ncbi:MAG: hypothetical protein WCE21_01205 [Candidatus Babeliales bacterium]
MNKKIAMLLTTLLMTTSGAWGMETFSKLASKFANFRLFEQYPTTAPASIKDDSTKLIKNYKTLEQVGATCGYHSAYNSISILEELLKNPEASLEDNEAISKRIFNSSFKTNMIPQLKERVITDRKQNALQQHILKWINTNFVFMLSDSTIEAESKPGTAKPMIQGGFTDFATFMAKIAVSKSGKTSINKQSLTIWLAEYFKVKKDAQKNNPDNNNVPEQYTLINKLNEYIQTSLENDPSLQIDEEQIHNIAQEYYTKHKRWSNYTTEYTDNVEVENLTKTITQFNKNIIPDYITVIGDTNELPLYIPTIANNWHNKKYPCHFFILGSMEQPTKGELKEHLTRLGEGHWITVCTHEQPGKLQTHVLDSMNHDQSNNPRVREIADQLSSTLKIPQVVTKSWDKQTWKNISTGAHSFFTKNPLYQNLQERDKSPFLSKQQLIKLGSTSTKKSLDELD